MKNRTLFFTVALATLITAAMAGAAPQARMGVSRYNVDASMQPEEKAFIPVAHIHSTGNATLSVEFTWELREGFGELRVKVKPISADIKPGRVIMVGLEVEAVDPGAYYGVLFVRPVVEKKGEGNPAVYAPEIPVNITVEGEVWTPPPEPEEEEPPPKQEEPEEEPEEEEEPESEPGFVMGAELLQVVAAACVAGVAGTLFLVKRWTRSGREEEITWRKS